MTNKISQKLQVGDDSSNLQAGRDININYSGDAKSEERDFEIIDEIFKNVVQKIKNKDYNRLDKKYLRIHEKIKLNFVDTKDKERVQDYFKTAYTITSLIETRMQEEDSVIQEILGGHIFEKYNKLKDEGLENINILEKLFGQFIIKGKEDNPFYTSCARAFVLFFFDDCTIFEKTKK